MKRYGLIYADQGSAMFVTGTADPRWANALEEFRTHPLDGRALEVVQPWRRPVVCRARSQVRHRQVFVRPRLTSR